MAALVHQPPHATGEDPFAASAAGRTVAMGQVNDVRELVRIFVLAADRRRVAVAKSMGVHLSELTALGHVRHARQLTPRDLAARLGITTPAVTALVDRLEQRDLVRRRPNPKDRRSILVTLTATGLATYDGAFTELSQVASAALDGLAEAEVETIRHFLRSAASSFLVGSEATVERLGVSPGWQLHKSSAELAAPRCRPVP